MSYIPAAKRSANTRARMKDALLLALLAVLLLLVAGCARPYWIKNAVPVTPTGERIVSQAEMDARFGPGRWGTFDRRTGITYISDAAPIGARACIRSHESGPDKSHATGWNHDMPSAPFLDCGDGTWLSVDTLRRMR